MSDARDRQTGETPPRSDQAREWEVFLREDDADSLRHAGSVSAPTVEVAREQAERLLGWSATAVWLCPADQVRRFSTDSLADRHP